MFWCLLTTLCKFQKVSKGLTTDFIEEHFFLPAFLSAQIFSEKRLGTREVLHGHHLQTSGDFIL